AAAKKAIWLQRMVFPLPGAPVMVANWRCGMPPPRSVSKPGMPVGNNFLEPGSMASLLDGRLPGMRCRLRYDGRTRALTSKLAEPATARVVDTARTTIGQRSVCSHGMRRRGHVEN